MLTFLQYFLVTMITIKYRLKDLVVFAFLLFLISSTNLKLKGQPESQSQDDPSDIPKLPIYVFRGYNIFTGNPLHSLKVDPGFGNILEDLTYKQQKTTQDLKFLIPDQVQSTKVTSCSFDTSISEFRGSQSYQDQLIIQAQMGGKFPIGLIKTAFSLSTSYKKIQNNTIWKNQSITHATAECEIYKISSDLFINSSLSDNFVNGAINSYKSNNWTNFVAQYGTHYVYEVIMGGRATQQISYSAQSISKLKTLGIDIHVAARAGFAQFFGDKSYDWQSYKTVIQYSMQMLQEKQEIYIGGVPPKNGDIYEWQQKIISDPMPISYKMFPISDLFGKIKNVFFKPTDAAAKFLDYLNSYCMENKCSNPLPDHPQPAPAKIQMNDTQSYGGPYGRWERWLLQSPTLNLKRIQVSYYGCMDRIQIMLSDGIVNYYSPILGGNGGIPQNEWVIPDKQYLSQVEYYTNDKVYGLCFITNTGIKSPFYGKTEGTYALLTIPAGFRIIGMYGYNTNNFVGRLGFIVARNIYSNGEEQPETKIITIGQDQ